MIKKIILIFELFGLILLSGQFVSAANRDNPKVYINFEEIAEIENYRKTEKNIYKKDGGANTPEIIIKLDLSNKRIYKNEFRFELDYELRDGQVYMEQKNAATVFNVYFFLKDGKVKQTEPLKLGGHSWTAMCNGLIAHAGGTTNNNKRVSGTNCREAVIYSYNQGHRVFEIDFNLTTDNKLAAVHDWHGYRGPMSSAKWAEEKIWTVFTSMMLEDVLDIMLVNKDMFLVTDTKSFEYTREQTELQFKILVEAAKKKDPELLERIVPQIYYQGMYDIVMKQHEFRSIIYTLYASPDSDRQVIDFVKKHRNIKVVTMGPVRGKPEFINELKNAGKFIYYFTLNDLQEILNYKKDGVRGFYTDYIFPDDLNNK